MSDDTQQVIVVGHDGRAGGRAAVQEAADLARQLGARLVVLEAVEPVMPVAGSALPLGGVPPLADPGDDVRAAQVVQERGREQVQEVLAGRDVAWEFEAVTGHAAQVLEERAAALDARLLVIGMPETGVGHAVQSLLQGSTSRRLSHSRVCPVLLAPWGEQ